MIEQAAETMKKRATRLKKRAERLREYLAVNMRRTGINDISCPEFSAKLLIERDASVDVFDEKQLPELYMKCPEPKTSPDNRLIGQAIKDGFDVPGARIVKRDRLVIG